MTPPAVENPGMEVHIHPFQLYSVKNNSPHHLYLHTSPEFCMKELLSSEENFDKIFQISYSFRDEPNSHIHRLQFLMLEWYRKDERYESIMKDIENLIDFVLENCHQIKAPLREEVKNKNIVKKTMQEIFQEVLKVDILNYLDIDSIKSLLLKFPDVPTPRTSLDWDDYFFLLYLNKIEPVINKYPLLMITEFPAHLGALSTIKKEDPRVCERFEVYINGIEICNCFNELTDVQEQKKRFLQQAQDKKRIYNYSLPEPKKFYSSMEKGLPLSSGVALGVERLLHSLFKIENPFYD